MCKCTSKKILLNKVGYDYYYCKHNYAEVPPIRITKPVVVKVTHYQLFSWFAMKLNKSK